MWLSKAAEQSQHEAQAELASLCEWGRGVPRDLNRAYLWRLLSQDGASKPNDQLRNLANQIDDTDIADAERRASEWRQAHPAKPKAELESALIPCP